MHLIKFLVRCQLMLKCVVTFEMPRMIVCIVPLFVGNRSAGSLLSRRNVVIMKRAESFLVVF